MLKVFSSILSYLRQLYAFYFIGRSATMFICQVASLPNECINEKSNLSPKHWLGSENWSYTGFMGPERSLQRCIPSFIDGTTTNLMFSLFGWCWNMWAAVMQVRSMGETKTVWKSISLMCLDPFSHYAMPNSLIGGSIKSFLILSCFHSSPSNPYLSASY